MTTIATASDTASIKDREHQSWTAVAPGWAKHDELLSRATAPVTERMLSAAGVGPGQRVLDIACGMGDPAISAAQQVGPRGRVLATDFVEEMLAFARDKADQKGITNLEFERADGETLPLSGGAGPFDAVLCRWGIMFMPDPLACLRRARELLAPDGRIAVACWAQPARNPWAALPLSVLRRHVEVPTPPPGAPGLFAFADPARLRATLEAAGFVGVGVDEVHIALGHVATGEAYFRFIRELAGPIARLYATLPPATQRIVDQEVAREAEQHRVGDSVALAAVTWVAHGRR